MSAVAQRNVVVRLYDGPCDGTFATIRAFNREVWQRVGKGQQAWCRYVKDLLPPGRFRWSGETVSTDTLARMLQQHTNAGNTYGESRGA